MLGTAASPFTNGLQRITDIVVPPGANLQGLNLPIHPNGVVYNSMARVPVAGATLTLLNAGSASPLPAGCFADAAQQGQITVAGGYYKFDVNFSNPACPSGGDYVIAVQPPPGHWHAELTHVRPPTHGLLHAPQCALSFVRFTHAPPHGESPPSQVGAPAEPAVADGLAGIAGDHDVDVVAVDRVIHFHALPPSFFQH